MDGSLVAEAAAADFVEELVVVENGDGGAWEKDKDLNYQQLAPSLPEESAGVMMISNGNVGSNRRESTAAAVGKRSKDVSSAVRKLDRELLPTTSSSLLKKSTAGSSSSSTSGSTTPRAAQRSSHSGGKVAVRRLEEAICSSNSSDGGSDVGVQMSRDSENGGNGNSSGSRRLGAPIMSVLPPPVKTRTRTTTTLKSESAPSTPLIRQSLSGALPSLSIPSSTPTADSRRASFSSVPTSADCNPRRSRVSLSSRSSLTRSVDITAAELRKWAAADAAEKRIPLKASGRPTSSIPSVAGSGSPRTPLTPKTPANFLRRSSSSSSISTPGKLGAKASASSPDGRSKPVVVPPSPSPSSASKQKLQGEANGAATSAASTPPPAARKKLSSSVSLLPSRRTSSFADGSSKLPLSSSPSFSSPGTERWPTPSTTHIDKRFTSSTTLFSSPPERRLSFGSNNNTKLSSPRSFSSINSNNAAHSKPPSPPTTATDRGPSMLNRRKSLESSRDSSRFLMLPPVADVKGGNDDARLDVRGQKLRSCCDGSLLHLMTTKLEFVYLRDNKLSNLNGIESLKRVKVLDISFNELKGGEEESFFQPLRNCKILQQLYLAGNQISSLRRLPQLPNLEVLSVAQNKIDSLAMESSQPRLQLLAAGRNKITTFKDFPQHLPSLQHLRLEENPILQQGFHPEAQAIMLVGPSLKKFNDRDLSIDEQELASLYPPHAALCIREGWELCAPEEAVDSTMQFLLLQWRKFLPPEFAVKKAHVDLPAEEDQCSCEFLFEKLEEGLGGDSGDSGELVLEYQWFVGGKAPTGFLPVQGAVSSTYWPKHEEVGHCLKVECSILIGERKFGPVFAISAPVSPGTGCPKILSLEVDGEAVEGSLIKGSAVVAWCGTTPRKSGMSWWRQQENGGSCPPVAIMGAEDSVYKPTLDDVGFRLIFMFTPVTEEGVKVGTKHCAASAVTPVIQAAHPSVSAVHIQGELVEGNVIRGSGKYFGGREGASKFEWLREKSLESGEFKLVSRGKLEYSLTDKDAGLRIMFMYTPIDTCGNQGDPVTAMSSKVKLTAPHTENLRILGDMKEGSKVAIGGIFAEGASCVQWFKKSEPGAPAATEYEQLEALSSSKVAKTFCIPSRAVGYYLVAKYMPVRADGESGEPTFIISESIVEMLPPGLTFLNMTGDCMEGETLTAQYGYVGGYEGVSQYEWRLHESKSDQGTSIPEARGQLQYRITKQAVNKFLSFRCKPVREDGLHGEWQSMFATERICAGFPTMLSLHILGEPIEGQELHMEKEYWGGEEGHSKVQWFLTQRQDWTQQCEIEGATQQSYTVSVDDLEGMICVSCQPVRSDGVTGPVTVSAPVGPVLPAPPRCEALEIHGSPVEGGSLSFEASYTGGEKGDCTHEWVRVNSDGGEELLSTDDQLDLKSEDVGSQIKLVFTPIRKDGTAGESRSVLSEEVVDAEPEGQELAIPQCFEDVEVAPQRRYFGGREGASEFTWYRTKHKPAEGGHLPKDAHLLCRTEVCTPRLDEVGSYLVLHWIPVRDDGKRAALPIIAYSDPVLPAFPEVCNVAIREVSEGMFVGEGVYYGGLEGQSHICWYRQTAANVCTPIPGAQTKTYVISDDDYTCSLIFGYTPVRSDGVSGNLVTSQPTTPIYPELPRIQKLVVSGKAMEGETLTALEVIPKKGSQQQSLERYTKEIRYQWSRSWQPESLDTYEHLQAQQSCTYKVRTEDVGYCLRCECVVLDVFGRSAEPIVYITSPVVPGFPRLENLEIDGRGFHTSLYAVRGIYSGGREGKSLIQWFRAMAGSPDLIPISGEVGRMYEANVDDVGYTLVAMYTPVREDGVEGGPVTAATAEPIIVDPEVAKEVQLKLDAGSSSVKFEALRDRLPLKTTTHRNNNKQQGFGILERRVVDVSRKRVKVIKPGSRTSFATTELRGTYAPPFHVEVLRSDQHRIKIVMDKENEVELMVQSRHLRDILVLVIRGFSHRFNSTPLNLLLKM
ncbi:unnamed protein product [Sphagnum tenellum]